MRTQAIVVLLGSLLAGCTAWGEPAEKVEPPTVEPPPPPEAASSAPVADTPHMGCGSRSGHADRLATDRETAAIQLEVAAAALHDLFRHNASGAQQSAGRVCIGLFDGDPPQALLDALADLGPNVMPASKFRKHRSDLILGVDTIRLVDDTHAEVNGGYYEASLSASGDYLTLERREGRWVVVDREMCWIS